MIKLVLYGRPITKKGHQQIVTNKKTGRPFVIQSAAYRKYEEDCLRQLMAYRGEIIGGPVWVKALYHMPDRRQPDLLNLEEATADILEKARIIANDKFIVSWDGSRIVGVDRENPRVEITVKEVHPSNGEN